jgi:hypothetical protein
VKSKPRVYLLLIGVAMVAVCGVVLILNQDLSTELLGAVGFVGGVAVIVNAVLDITGNGD